MRWSGMPAIQVAEKSNSVRMQLLYAGGFAFAPAAEFIGDAARGLGTGDGCFLLRAGIVGDALGTLGTLAVGWQLGQRRDLQAGTRANPNPSAIAQSRALTGRRPFVNFN